MPLGSQMIVFFKSVHFSISSSTVILISAKTTFKNSEKTRTKTKNAITDISNIRTNPIKKYNKKFGEKTF